MKGYLPLSNILGVGWLFADICNALLIVMQVENKLTESHQQYLLFWQAGLIENSFFFVDDLPLAD